MWGFLKSKIYDINVIVEEPTEVEIRSGETNDRSQQKPVIEIQDLNNVPFVLESVFQEESIHEIQEMNVNENVVIEFMQEKEDYQDSENRNPCSASLIDEAQTENNNADELNTHKRLLNKEQNVALDKKELRKKWFNQRRKN